VTNLIQCSHPVHCMHKLSIRSSLIVDDVVDEAYFNMLSWDAKVQPLFTLP
jgi:hypothetical protein